jgi:hypothetical protein
MPIPNILFGVGSSRDRNKSLWFERRGWRIVRFSARQVNYSLQDTILAIEQIIGYCHEYEAGSWLIKQQSFDRSEFILR